MVGRCVLSESAYFSNVIFGEQLCQQKQRKQTSTVLDSTSLCLLLSHVDYFFLLKLTLSFLAGYLYVTVATAVAERKGASIGGIIISLPSTLLISLLFIGWTQSLDTAVKATTIVPAVAGGNCLFVAVYVFLLRKGLFIALPAAFLTWLFLSLGLVYSGFHNFLLGFVFYALLFFLSRHIADTRKLTDDGTYNNPRRISFPPVYRGVLSGSIVLLAVCLSRIGGPALGGAFAMFPAMFTGTIIITYLAHGPSFSAALMKASIPGTFSTVIYAVCARYTYPVFGLAMGTIISVAISYSSIFLIHRLGVKAKKKGCRVWGVGCRGKD